MSSMGQRDDRYTLEGMIEMDEGYFTIHASPKDHATQKNQCYGNGRNHCA